MMNRREAIQGLGFLGLGFLFRGKLGKGEAVAPLVPEPIYLNQPPSAIDITVEPQYAFRPERLVVSSLIAPFFIIENITIGKEAQFVGPGIPAECFAPDAMDNAMNMVAVGPGMPIKFRVRYVGNKPEGEQFMAALLGRHADSGLDGRPARRMVLPISSGHRIVA